MKGIKQKTFLLYYLTIVTIACFFVGLLQSSIKVNIGIVLLIVFAAALPVTFIILKIMYMAEMSKPYAKLHKDFMNEIWTNGYTDKVREIGEYAIYAHRNESHISFPYIADFVLYLSDYYNLTGQYGKTFPLIWILNRNELASRGYRLLDGGYYILMYYAVWMEACRGVKNREMAQQIIEEGRPFLDKKFKQDIFAMTADYIAYNYYMIVEDYGMAVRCVDKLMSYQSLQAYKFFIRYYAAAEINVVFGNKEKARKILEQGKKMAGENLAVVCQSFEVYRLRLGL